MLIVSRWSERQTCGGHPPEQNPSPSRTELPTWARRGFAFQLPYRQPGGSDVLPLPCIIAPVSKFLRDVSSLLQPLVSLCLWHVDYSHRLPVEETTERWREADGKLTSELVFICARWPRRRCNHTGRRLQSSLTQQDENSLTPNVKNKNLIINSRLVQSSCTSEGRRRVPLMSDFPQQMCHIKHVECCFLKHWSCSRSWRWRWCGSHKKLIQSHILLLQGSKAQAEGLQHHSEHSWKLNFLGF